MKNITSILSETLDTGEPVFLIRAKDSLSLAALDSYIRDASFSDCTTEFLNELEEIRESFSEWQLQNLDQVRIPD